MKKLFTDHTSNYIISVIIIAIAQIVGELVQLYTSTHSYLFDNILSSVHVFLVIYGMRLLNHMYKTNQSNQNQ